MRAIVVYESMYGNTHRVAEAVGVGLRSVAHTDVVSVHDAPPSLLAEADLVVVGGPTHTHGMSHDSTRKAAIDAITKPDNDLTLEPDEVARARAWGERLAGLASAG